MIKNRLKKREDIGWSIGLALISLFFIFKFLSFQRITESKYKVFKTVVTSTPVYKKTHKGSPRIYFDVKGVEATVVLINASLDAVDSNDFIKGVNIGDSVTLSIRNRDYDWYVKNKRNKKFLSNDIAPYQLKIEDKFHITLDMWYHYTRKDYFIGFIFGVIILIFILYSWIKKISPITLAEKNKKLTMFFALTVFIFLYIYSRFIYNYPF